MRILVLGAGFGGVCTAKYLLKYTKNITNVKITLIDRNTYHFFTPFLHEVATASIHADHIKRPLRLLFKGDNVEYHQGEVNKVDFEKRSVSICSSCEGCRNAPKCTHYEYFNKADFTINREREFLYDYLVIAMGSQPNFFGVPGAEEHAYTLSSIKSAEHVKKRILECFELANHTNDLKLKKELLTFVVVGAGATGTEFIVELHDLCKNILSEEFEFISFERDCRIILVEAMEHILPNMDSYLVDYAMGTLKDKNIEIMTSTQVTNVSKCSVELNGSDVIPTHNVLWAAGVKANQLVSGLDAPKDSINRLKVNEYLQLIKQPGVFALGDNASFVASEGERPLMQTAQVAVQEAKYVATNIVKHFKNEPMTEFKYVFLGATVSLGGKTGVANLVGKFELRGFSGWLSWKLTYLRHLLVTEKPLRAIWDWSYDMFYNRHLARFKLHE